MSTLKFYSKDSFGAAQQWYVRVIDRSQIEKRPAVYRWWFDETYLIDKAIKELLIKKEKILSSVINDKTYYALYVGKATSARQRLSCHLPKEGKLGFRTSTLRRTLRALLCKKSQTPLDCASIVDKYMNDHAILEWKYFKEETNAKDTESAYIRNGYYPLNNSENEQLRQWTKKLTELRKVFN